MGSQAMFAPWDCDRCHNEYDQCYPAVWLCEKCEREIRSNFLAGLLRQRLQLEPSAEMCLVIVGFLMIDRCKGARLLYLHNVLRSRESPFLQFTYASNGMQGNISETEDILDRIMSFM